MNARLRLAALRMVAAGWALATFAFFGFSSESFHVKAMLWNDLDPGDRLRMFAFVGAGMGAGLVSSYLLARRDPDRLVAISYRAFLVVPIGLLPLYQVVSLPFVRFFVIVAIGALYAWSLWLFAHRSPEGGAVTALDSASSSRAGALLATALACTNAYWIAHLVVERCLALEGGWDLMIHNSLHYNVVTTGRAWTTGLWRFPVDHYGNHFAPIEHLSSIVYAFHKTPETLVALQAVMICLAALFVYGIGRRLTGSTTVGVLLSASFGFNSCVSNVCWYDFHEAAFLVPTLLGLVWACVAEKKWLIVLFAVLALNSREDGGLWVALFGAVWWSRGKRTGLRLAIAGAITLVLVNFVVMPYIRSTTGQPVWLTDRYSAIARGAQIGLARTIESVATNPGFVISYVISNPEKWLFLAQLFVPVALLPLVTRRGIVLIGPPIAFSVLSVYPPMYSINFHYTVQILPFLYLATAFGLERLERRTAIAMAATTLVATTLVSGRYGPHPILNQPLAAMELSIIHDDYGDRAPMYRRMALDVPQEGCAMGSHTLVTPLSSRRLGYRFPDGKDCDYALLDFGEKSWQRDAETARAIRAWLLDATRSGAYGVMFADDRVALVGKGKPTDRNAELIRVLSEPPAIPAK